MSKAGHVYSNTLSNEAKISLLPKIHACLPRLLSLFDVDRTSATHGLGDRLHWAWNIKDFANGTFQGAVNGLARLIVLKGLPDFINEKRLLEFVLIMIEACEPLRRKDGSFEETYPYEGSYCVTSLVASDILAAVLLLQERLTKKQKLRCLDIVKPMIHFLKQNSETHGFISNHLATAALAFYQWHVLTGGDTDKNTDFITQNIIANQSKEGWYLEYQGCDPGYQTLCIHYLAELLRLNQSEMLKQSLIKATTLLANFVHPDGSFGGVYGSRNTSFYYPSGVLYLAHYCQSAANVAAEMFNSIKHASVVTLDAMDESNLIPMFNAYCCAYHYAEDFIPAFEPQPVPSLAGMCKRIVLEDAGMIIDIGKSHYSVISVFKGGVVYHFQDGKLKMRNCGVVFSSKDRKPCYSSQSYSEQNMWYVDDKNRLIVVSDIVPMTKQQLLPWKLILLRLGNVSFLRIRAISELVKQILVNVLVTRKGKNQGQNIRTVSLGYDLKIADESKVNPQLKHVADVEHFVSIHMASKNYWQRQELE